MEHVFFRYRLPRWFALLIAYVCTLVLTNLAAITVFSMVTPTEKEIDVDFQPHVMGLFLFALVIGVQLHWVAKRLSPDPNRPEKTPTNIHRAGFHL